MMPKATIATAAVSYTHLDVYKRQLLAFAIVFQTPVVLLLLARIGIINSRMLRKYRRYIGFGMLVVGGALAPDGSPVTMVLIAGPMFVLFEASIWLLSLIHI